MLRYAICRCWQHYLYTTVHLLKTISRRFTVCVRSRGIVARLGGDEFVVICSQVVNTNIIGLVGDQLRAEAAIPVVFGEIEVNLGAKFWGGNRSA